ncbi:MAG: response regulator [Deltaproteobacteria bacterium]
MTETRVPRIVIADDEMHIRVLIRKALTSMNYNVVGEAANGNEAVNLFKKERPDLILLDINMPFKSGQEALQEIIAESPDTLAIMLTSVSDMESVEKCIAAGATGYIRKDTPLAEIKSMISEVWQTYCERGE